MTVNAAALLNELKTDPKQLHYAGQPTAQLLALLNTPGLSGETCPNAAVDMADVMIVIDLAEWSALTQPIRDYLIRVSYFPTIDLTNPVVQGKIASIFPAQGNTAKGLAALETRPCSRAEALFAPGDAVTANDLTSAAALNGGTLP